jgi:hypothetical protein
MANVANEILAAVLNFGVAEAEANKPAILAAAHAAGVNLEKAADLFIESVKVGGALAIVAGALKSALVSAVNAQIEKGLSEEDALFALVISAAQNEAKKLAA